MKLIHFRGLLSFLATILLMSCAEKNAKPEAVLDETQMVEVLTDVCKVEARYQRRLTIDNINQIDMVAHNYQLAFTKHQISLQQFKDSYAYYEKTPIVMQEIYDSVIVRLTQEQAFLEKAALDSSSIVP